MVNVTLNIIILDVFAFLSPRISHILSTPERKEHLPEKKKHRADILLMDTSPKQ